MILLKRWAIATGLVISCLTGIVAVVWALVEIGRLLMALFPDAGPVIVIVLMAASGVGLMMANSWDDVCG